MHSVYERAVEHFAPCDRFAGARMARNSYYQDIPAAMRPTLVTEEVVPGSDHTRSALGASLATRWRTKACYATDSERRSPRLARSTTDTGSLGVRFWGQVRGSPGRLRILQGKGATSGETSQIAGKARYQAPFPGHIAAGESSMVRRGSTVRVRQRASQKARKWLFCCLGRTTALTTCPQELSPSVEPSSFLA